MPTLATVRDFDADTTTTKILKATKPTDMRQIFLVLTYLVRSENIKIPLGKNYVLWLFDSGAPVFELSLSFLCD
jgi:hypothetical protein